MILLAHILIALSGVLYTTYLLFFPSLRGIRTSQALVALTAASGVLLIIVKPQNWAHVCLSGLVYIAIVSVGIFVAQKKLAAASHTAQ
jgi:hypothetical protein